MKSTISGAALAATFFVSVANAFWKLPCDSPVLVERADPIVNPGKVAGHLHTIMGGNGFDFTMDFDQAQNSTCSTCSVTIDKSNYWIPTLLYQAQNGSFHPVKQLGGALIYYMQRTGYPGEKLHAFPPGFEMLAGDPFLRSYSSTKEQRAVSYACIDYKNPSAETPGFPKNNCPNGLRTQIFFPSCWDGKNLKAPDHKSHMAYPDGVNNGKCPSTHPVRLISIFYETLWAVDEWKDQWYDGKFPFVLSNGDPTGYGLHGDFVNGWDTETLQLAIDNCNDPLGDIKKCPYFEYFNKDVQGDCMIPPRIDEQTTGWMDKLPGCNPITHGPGKAKSVSNCGATTEIGPPTKYETDVSTMGWEYVGCALDNLNDRTLPVRTGADDMTVEKCVDYCAARGHTFAGVEYARECYCGGSIAQDRLGFAKCLMPCAGDSKQFCGGAQRLSVYKKSIGGTAPKPSTSRTSSVKTSTTPRPATSTTVKPITPTVTPTPTPTSRPTTVSTLKPTSTKPTSTTTPIKQAPTNVTVPPGWAYTGCWVDPVNPRALATVGYWRSKVETSGCIKHCSSKGFKYAGTEFGGQCFCSNTLSGGKAAPESECNMRCEGNNKQFCGGSARLSLFAKKGATIPVPKLKRNSPALRYSRRHNPHH